MIPRLSGRIRPSDPVSGKTTPLPSRSEAQKVIEQFFRLIERFSIPGEDPAPETKNSRTRAARRKSLSKDVRGKP